LSHPQVKPSNQNPQDQLAVLQPAYKPIDLLEILHREVNYQQDLISSRITWYVTSQAFLMSAFAIAGGENHHFPWLTRGFLPALGIIISIFIAISIRAGVAIVDELRQREYELISQEPELRKLAFLDLHERVANYHLQSKSILRFIPPVFLVAWVIALILAWTVVRES
jgi:hypothetical protein